MHVQSTSTETATIGFYLLMGLAALTRTLWFATSYGIISMILEQTEIMMGDEGWERFLLTEAVEMLGSFFIYSIFVLIVVFWADMLRRLFTHEHVRSHPLRNFCFILGSVLCLQAFGFGIFMLQKASSFWLMTYDAIILCGLTFGCLVSILIYSYRMRTVLQAFLDVSHIDTTDRIKAVNWATSISVFFLVVNSIYLCYSIISLVFFHQVDAFLDSKRWWWVLVAYKHLIEIFVLYSLLFTLWGKSNKEENHQQQKEGYEPIPDHPLAINPHSDEEEASSTTPTTKTRLHQV
jgi:hypothetical protein